MIVHRQALIDLDKQSSGPKCESDRIQKVVNGAIFIRGLRVCTERLRIERCPDAESHAHGHHSLNPLGNEVSKEWVGHPIAPFGAVARRAQRPA